MLMSKVKVESFPRKNNHTENNDRQEMWDMTWHHIIDIIFSICFVGHAYGILFCYQTTYRWTVLHKEQRKKTDVRFIICWASFVMLRWASSLSLSENRWFWHNEILMGVVFGYDVMMMIMIIYDSGCRGRRIKSPFNFIAYISKVFRSSAAHLLLAAQRWWGVSL